MKAWKLKGNGILHVEKEIFDNQEYANRMAASYRSGVGVAFEVVPVQVKSLSHQRVRYGKRIYYRTVREGDNGQCFARIHSFDRVVKRDKGSNEWVCVG